MTKKMVRLSLESKKELDDLIKEENKNRPPEYRVATQEWMLGNLIRNAWLELGKKNKGKNNE